MSALAALYSRDGGTLERGKLERMLGALEIFGRNATRSAHLGQIAMGACLHWTVPEDVGAPQPVKSRDGRFVMVFDGRVDNRDELARDMNLSAVDARSLSDAQLFMRGFETFGEEIYTRSIADFVLILWDTHEKSMSIVTDPMGIRGVYYYVSDSMIHVASMPRGLHALPEVPRELDEQKVADALAQFMCDPTKSMFKDIFASPAASIMTFRGRDIETRRYYRLMDTYKPLKYKRDEDYVEEAKAILQTAVKARLRTNKKIGALMSGGLDSSTVAVTVAPYLAEQGKRLPTFTWVPQDNWDGKTEAHCYGDETPFVKSIAAKVENIDLNLTPAKDRGHYYRQDEYLRYVETPMRNAALLGWMHTIMETAKDQDIGVMFVGDSGNMTLSYRGDALFFDLFKRGRWIQLCKELWHREQTPIGWLRWFNATVIAGLMSNRTYDMTLKLRGKKTLDERWTYNSTVKKEFGEAMRIPERAREAAFDFFGRPPAANRYHWREVMDEMRGGMFAYAHAFTAMHGIETRDPLGDRRMVEFINNVPEDQFLRDGDQRFLIKRVMDGLLPDDVRLKTLHVGRINSDWQVRHQKDLPRMRDDISVMRDDPDLSRMVDLDRLEGWLDDWPEETVTSPDDDRRFLLAVNLPMALNAARFVEIVKGRNR